MSKAPIVEPHRPVVVPYRSPRLTRLGPVTRLTAGLGNYTSEENGYRIG